MSDEQKEDEDEDADSVIQNRASLGVREKDINDQKMLREAMLKACKTLVDDCERMESSASANPEESIDACSVIASALPMVKHFYDAMFRRASMQLAAATRILTDDLKQAMADRIREEIEARLSKPVQQDTPTAPTV